MKEYKESLFELALTYTSKDMVNEIADKYPDPEELKGKYEFSPEFEKWAEDLLRKEKKQNRNKNYKDAWNIVFVIMKKGAVTICTAIALFALMAFSIPSIRVSLANYAIQLNEKHIAMELQNSEEETQEENTNDYSYIIPYVPEGFEIVEEVNSDNLIVINYINKEDESIRFERYIGSVNLTIDNEENDFEEILINGAECYLSTKNGINTIIFNTENYGYIISSEIELDEIKNMAENIIK